jgi:hypothetical protein
MAPPAEVSAELLEVKRELDAGVTVVWQNSGGGLWVYVDCGNRDMAGSVVRVGLVRPGEPGAEGVVVQDVRLEARERYGPHGVARLGPEWRGHGGGENALFVAALVSRPERAGAEE